MAIEATSRLWRSAAKSELLGTSIRVTDQQYPRLAAAAKKAATALHLETPPVYVAPSSSKVRAHALGTNHDAYIVVNNSLVERFSDEELVALVGNELGHIQNNHVVYTTALFYLTHSAMMFVRWIVQPAIMTLQAWARRAEITCDRAALLATRDLGVTLTALIKFEVGLEDASNFDVDEYLQQLPGTKKGIGRFAELFRSYPYLPKRVQALNVFADGALYKRVIGETGGLSAEEVDGQVQKILSMF
jgi:Zn-dependent protease with chaperone function